MTQDEQINSFYSLLSSQYNDIKKKYKQFCFLNGLTYSDDVLHSTILKVVEMVNKKGLSACNDKEIEHYFFKAYKLNTYQEHLQEQKKNIDNNVNPFDLNIVDEQYDESHYNYARLASVYILQKVKQEFGELTAAIWRLRYLVRVNGEEMNYKEIKRLTKIHDVRRRIVEANRWVKENIKKEDIDNAIKLNQIF